jgi:3-hydroxyisobutyrate dehydrogenase-like beta-hydroxyacid dehydrogenase
MGIGMATSLAKAGFPVCGYDIYPPSVERFLKLGEKASRAQTPADAAVDAQVLVLMVQNAVQAEDVLFGSGKAADSLPNDSVVILSSTVPPSFVRDLRSRLVGLGRNIDLVDAPVSGGVVRAANGQLTVFLPPYRFLLHG